MKGIALLLSAYLVLTGLIYTARAQVDDSKMGRSPFMTDPENDPYRSKSLYSPDDETNPYVQERSPYSPYTADHISGKQLKERMKSGQSKPQKGQTVITNPYDVQPAKNPYEQEEPAEENGLIQPTRTLNPYGAIPPSKPTNAKPPFGPGGEERTDSKSGRSESSAEKMLYDAFGIKR